MQNKKRKLLQYQGFDIVLPDNMFAEKSFVIISGRGKYYVDTGDSDIGCINRIDNKLNSLSDFILEHKNEIERLSERKTDIIAELQEENSYPAEILRLQKKLKKIDKELGVDEK
jgi:hypothetical protein